MYGVLIALHVISCLVLIMVILLQAGKGGGISETFGGSGGL
ncbi:MAG: preprotein translocase subunit SecG, partial [Candidatus Omnitrophica bacterium]|nr:preprotein translocase subunit SecG [Candidatus Omnitrophota bacterium]